MSCVCCVWRVFLSDVVTATRHKGHCCQGTSSGVGSFCEHGEKTNMFLWSSVSPAIHLLWVMHPIFRITELVMSQLGEIISVEDKYISF